MSEPAVISVAPNGARRTFKDHPGMPITTPDIVREAAKCREAGAAMIHLHVRDDRGGHLLDADAYTKTTAAIRHAVGDDLIVQITTEAVGVYQPEQQMAVVRDVRPEAASVALREIVPDDQNLFAAEDFYTWMARERVMAQHILYTPEEIRRFNALRARGVIPGDCPVVLFVLGSYGGAPGDPKDLSAYLDALNEGGPAVWGVCSFGVAEAQAARWALAHGGHPRVGFENNLMLESGAQATSNAELVKQTVEDAALANRTIADAAEARKIFNGETGAWASDAQTGRQGAAEA